MFFSSGRLMVNVTIPSTRLQINSSLMVLLSSSNHPLTRLLIGAKTGMSSPLFKASEGG
jgi:hypothetical protein